MSSPLDVLAIAAHPDDAEFGCGGTLLRAVDAGLSVGIIDLTEAELSTQGDVETRARERDRASTLLGLAARIGLGLPDGGLDGGAPQRKILVRALRTLRPRVLLAPYPEDRHPDHGAAGRLARDAAYLAGVRRYYPGEAPHRPAALYHYMLHQPFPPTFVVNVGSVNWERRTQVVEVYASQFGGPAADARTVLAGPRFLSVIEARASWFGAMIGVERGEPFWSAGPLALDGLPDGGGRDDYRMFV